MQEYERPSKGGLYPQDLDYNLPQIMLISRIRSLQDDKEKIDAFAKNYAPDNINVLLVGDKQRSLIV